MDQAIQIAIQQCAGLLTDFLEDNREPEEQFGEAYPDVSKALQILSGLIGLQGSLPVIKPDRPSEKVRSSTDNLGDYGGFENISVRAYEGEMSPEKKFDELLEELENDPTGIFWG